MNIVGYESKTEDDFIMIKLKDVTILNPEVILVDSNNKGYELKDGSRSYKLGKTNEAEFYLDRELNEVNSLPRNVPSRALMIRSDKPLKCDLTGIDNDLK